MSRAPQNDADPAMRAAFEAENLDLCARGGRAACWLWIAVIPAFLIVDLARFPGQAPHLLWLRVANLLVTVLVIAVLRTERGKLASRWIVLLLATVGGTVTFAMMASTGGHGSSYFGGVGLVMLVTALLMPWPAVWTWATCGALLALYLGYSFLLEPIGDGRAFANNLASYAATALIAGVATTGRARLRRQEFSSRWRLELSQEMLAEQAETSMQLARAGRALIAAPLDVEHIAEELSRVTVETIGCDCSHTILFDADERRWRAVAQYGDSPEQWAALRHVSVSAPAAEDLLRRLRSSDIVQVRHDEESSPWACAALAAGITRTMLVALRRTGDEFGVLAAGLRGSAESFAPLQERLLLGLAQLGSVKLTNAKLYSELGRQSEAERAARAEAEEANRAKDEFLATLSHEMRTPLNVILGYLEMLHDSQLVEEERTDVLDALDVASRQLLDMITDTLEISRIHAGDLRPQVAEISLPEFWAELQASCMRLPRRPSVELLWRKGSSTVLFEQDRRMLLLILRNLIGNGLKFTERGSVEVSVELTEDGLVFRVADTGIGIAAENQAAIFDKFRQIDSSDTRRFGGVGLGLYIVRRFAESLGGVVSVESRLHEGSTFTLRLSRTACALRAA